MVAASLLSPRTLPLLVAALALAGCGDSVETPIEPEPVEDLAPVPQLGPVEQEAAVTDPVELSDCNGRLAQPFIGRQAGLDIKTALLEAVSPNQNVRWIGPGESITGTLEPTRLTVFLDDREVITGVRCG